MRRLFLDSEGRLGLGWRVVLYLVGFVATAAIASTAGYFLHAAHMATELAQAVSGLLQVLGILTLTLLMRRRVDKRSWAGMALPPLQRGLREAAVGFGIGAALQLIVFEVERAMGWATVFSNDLSGPRAASAWAMAAAGLALFLSVGFTEELVMRGYLLQNFAERIPLWQATVAVGLIFGVAHVASGGVDAWFLLGAVLITVSFVVTRMVTGSLWMAIGWHAAWDWTQHSLLGLDIVPGSGFESSLLHVKQTGPALWIGTAPHIEGGLLFSMVDAVALVLLWVWARRTRRPIRWFATLAPEGTPQPPATAPATR